MQIILISSLFCFGMVNVGGGRFWYGINVPQVVEDSEHNYVYVC